MPISVLFQRRYFLGSVNINCFDQIYIVIFQTIMLTVWPYVLFIFIFAW